MRKHISAGKVAVVLCAALAVGIAVLSTKSLCAEEGKAGEKFILSSSEETWLNSMRERPLRVGYSYELLYRVSPDGRAGGMLQPFLDLLQNVLGLTVEMKKLDWHEAFSALERDEIDFYGLIGLNVERKRQYRTTEPLFRAQALAITRIGRPLESMINLKNRKIGMLAGSMLRDSLATYLQPSGSAVYYPSMDAMIDGLEAGEIDAFIGVDNADLEILRHPSLTHEFTIHNFYTNQGFISGREDMEPLIAMIDRYLKTPAGGALKAAIEDVRRDELLRSRRAAFSEEIAYVRERYDVVRMVDGGALYPLSYIEEGVHRGFQIRINHLFEELTGLTLRVDDGRVLEDGLFTALDLIRTGKYHLTSAVPPVPDFWDDPVVDYSLPIWSDSLRTYVRSDEKRTNLHHMRVGTTLSALQCLNWDTVAGKKPALYKSRQALMTALKNKEIDAAFVSEMTFNYYHTVLRDYSFQELDGTVATTNLHSIYGDRNPELNRLYDEAIRLYQVMYPEGRARWRFIAKKNEADYVRRRDVQHALFSRAAVVFCVMGALLLYSLRRYAKYDRQISLLLRKQQTIDLLWGDLRSGRLYSKGNYPFFRKWGLQPAKATSSMSELSRIFGWDVYEDFAGGMEKMRRDNISILVMEKKIPSPQDERITLHYRLYLHRLSDHEFMSCLQDVTDETHRMENLTRAATTDFLSTLLTRRAMDDLLIRKCVELHNSGRHAFLLFIDIDDFKKINDNYGHDVGDHVLREVSGVIQNTEGCGHSTSRWGGEEFLTLLECDGREAAEETALAILTAVEDLETKIQETEKMIRVTVSIGIAELDCRTQEYTASLRRADEALYEAKRAGKNRVCFKK